MRLKYYNIGINNLQLEAIRKALKLLEKEVPKLPRSVADGYEQADNHGSHPTAILAMLDMDLEQDPALNDIGRGEY